MSNSSSPPRPQVDSLTGSYEPPRGSVSPQNAFYNQSASKQFVLLKTTS